MKMPQKKKGQTLIEFLIVAIIVGLAFIAVLRNMDAKFFRSYFKGSVSSSTGIDSNGQMTMQRMGD